MQRAYVVTAVLLGLFYLYAGGRKLVQDKDRLRPMMEWVDDVPLSRVRLIGGLEVAGVVGLALAPVPAVGPVVALLAALGFVVLQVLAFGVHYRRGGLADTWLNVLLAIFAAATAWFATALF